MHPRVPAKRMPWQHWKQGAGRVELVACCGGLCNGSLAISGVLQEVSRVRGQLWLPTVAEIWFVKPATALLHSPVSCLRLECCMSGWDMRPAHRELHREARHKSRSCVAMPRAVVATACDNHLKYRPNNRLRIVPRRSSRLNPTTFVTGTCGWVAASKAQCN